MLAGGSCIAGGCTPAKPHWSEVIIFLDVLLRRKDCCPEVQTSTAVNAVYIYGPLALTAVSMIFVCLYKLDKEYDNIIKDLDELKLEK